jgi:hypothetical protein
LKLQHRRNPELEIIQLHPQTQQNTFRNQEQTYVREQQGSWLSFIAAAEAGVAVAAGGERAAV